MSFIYVVVEIVNLLRSVPNSAYGFGLYKLENRLYTIYMNK